MATIRDVAKHAGVSVATVSRVRRVMFIKIPVRRLKLLSESCIIRRMR